MFNKYEKYAVTSNQENERNKVPCSYTEFFKFDNAKC